MGSSNTPFPTYYEPDIWPRFRNDPPPDNLPHNTPAGLRKPEKPYKPIPGDQAYWDRQMKLYHEMLYGY